MNVASMTMYVLPNSICCIAERNIQVRVWKAVLALVLALTAAVETVSLGFSATIEDPETIATHSLRLIFAIYVLVLAVRSINQDTIESHSVSLWHISTLTFVSAVVNFGTIILPPTPAPVGKTSVAIEETSTVLTYLGWTAIALYCVAFIIASTLPQGPPLRFEPEHIYSQKTIASTTNTSPDNVCGVTGMFFPPFLMRNKTNLTNIYGKVASVWDTLLFSYTTKVVMLGNISESLEIGDLPIVPASIRATHLFKLMKSALRTPIPTLSFPFTSFRLFSFRKGSGWEILCKLMRLNKWVLIYEVALAAASAVLWYAPAFFLQKLVKYLEQDPEREDRRWGWVFVAGMFGFNALTMLGAFSFKRGRSTYSPHAVR